MTKDKLSMEELGDKLDTVMDAVSELKNINEGVREGHRELESGDGVEEVVVPNVPQGISTKTIVSVIVSVIVFLNLILSFVAPHLEIKIAEDLIYTVGSILAVAINFAYAMWKNHDFTKKARLRTEVADQVVPKNEK